MKKKAIISMIIGIVLIIAIYIITFSNLFVSGIKISICNETLQDIGNIFITYTGSKSDIAVPVIVSGKTETVSVDLPDDFSEGNMTLYYYNRDNEKYEKIIIGYMEKNYNYKIKLSIESIDENGIMNISE